MHRALPWRTKAVNRLATVAGKALAATLRTWLGLVGAGLVTVSAWMVAVPLGLLVGGAFLLVLDHRSSG